MITMIPPTIFAQIVQTKSSPETIAALLNEAENTYSNTRRHWNAKRLYPFWKACPICGTPFSVANNDQYYKVYHCSPECSHQAISHAKKGQGIKPLSERKGQFITCACGKVVWKPDAWLRKAKEHYCSGRCNGRVRSKELVKHSANGKGKKNPKKGSPGASNPAWKGGVTYFKKHGNYTGVKYIRCLPTFISMARKDGYVMEHRIIVAQAIGRLLLRTEVVHHKDHNPANNDLSNLQLFASNRDHKLFEHHGFPLPIWQL